MPVVTIPLIPPDLSQDHLWDLVESVQDAVAGVPELGLTRDDVTVLLPADILAKGIGTEIPVLVTGLFKKPERTPEVRQRLWDAIGEAVHDFAALYIPQCTKVEVIPTDYDQDRDGFYCRFIKR